MFNGFIQAFKEIGSGGPPVQDGKIIHDPKTYGTEKPVVFDEDGELTEEGFVSIGQSSFIYSTQKYPDDSSVPPNLSAIYPPLPKSGSASSSPGPVGRAFNGPAQTMYRSPIPSMPVPAQVSVLDKDFRPESELVRGLPFVLHPSLRTNHNSGTVQRHLSLLNENMRHPIGDLSQFSYDFEFERRVLRDIQHQY